jgi:hypothetical protein
MLPDYKRIPFLLTLASGLTLFSECFGCLISSFSVKQMRSLFIRYIMQRAVVTLYHSLGKILIVSFSLKIF